MPGIESRLGRDMLVLEGGLATILDRYGMGGEECPEVLNIIEPDLVTEIHRLFNLAGATCAISNTFGASSPVLDRAGLSDRVFDINAEGVRLARAAHPQHVLGDIGSCGIDPTDEESASLAREAYSEQAAALASANPDAIYIEAMTSLADALCALDATVHSCDLPVIVSVTVAPDGAMTRCRTPIEEAAAALEAHGASAVGISCSLVPGSIAAVAERLAHCCDLPLLASPDVGMVSVTEDGQINYSGTTDEMESAAVMLRKLGFSIIGSCCGSTPAFTGAIYAAVGEMEAIAR